MWLRQKGLDFALSYIEAEDLQTNYVDIGPVNKSLNMLCVFAAHGRESEVGVFVCVCVCVIVI